MLITEVTKNYSNIFGSGEQDVGKTLEHQLICVRGFDSIPATIPKIDKFLNIFNQEKCCFFRQKYFKSKISSLRVVFAKCLSFLKDLSKHRVP